jgi:hypothetical protein
MGLVEDVRFAIGVSNPPSYRAVGGNQFPLGAHTDSDTRFRALENAVLALASAIELLAQRVEEMPREMRGE